MPRSIENPFISVDRTDDFACIESHEDVDDAIGDALVDALVAVGELAELVATSPLHRWMANQTEQANAALNRIAARISN